MSKPIKVQTRNERTTGVGSFCGLVRSVRLGLAAGLNTPWAMANPGTKKSGKKRVVILVDTETHMMPALAKEMARRDHNLVIGM